MNWSALIAAIALILAALSNLVGLEERVPKKLRKKAPPEQLAAWQKTLVPGDLIGSAGVWMVFFAADRNSLLCWMGIALFCLGIGINIILGLKFRKNLT